jgi:hypothetical protein
MAKVLCVLYDDPVDGHPKSYARDNVPKLDPNRTREGRGWTVMRYGLCSALARSNLSESGVGERR